MSACSFSAIVSKLPKSNIEILDLSSDIDNILHEKDGIAPYELSDSDDYLLRCLGMEYDSILINYNAPDNALTFSVTFYTLGADMAWEYLTGGNTVSFGPSKDAGEEFKGTFSIILKDNMIEYRIISDSCVTTYSLTDFKYEGMSYCKIAPTEFMDIEINQEVPVFLLVCNNNDWFYSFSLNDYYDTSRLKEMTSVLAVTFTFTDDCPEPLK
jgi:hypothetical protein